MKFILNETVRTIQEACKRFPSRRAGRGTHASTLIRYILHGLGGVKLEAVKFGGTWLTSEEAIQRFLSAVTRSKDESAAALTDAVVDNRLAAEGLIDLDAEKGTSHDA